LQNIYTKEKSKIRACFNRAARSYDDHCHLQFRIGKDLINLLSRHMSSFPKLIDVGCGTGKLTKELADALHYDYLVAIDNADAVIEIARSRLSSLAVKVVHADFDDVPLPNKAVDAVFSNMALQWSLNFGATLIELSRILTTQGMLAFSVPIKGTFVELRQASRKFLTIAEITEQLVKLNYKLIETVNTQHTFYFENIFQLLKSIKQVGATHIEKPLVRSLGSRGYLTKLEKYYLESFGKDGRLPLTYSIILIVARKVN
jgi:malonyl-CoA O-methyltransferase